MEYKDVLAKVNELFIDIIDESDIVLNDITTAKDVEGWDSMTNIQLVIAIEKHFKIKFTTAEIQNWSNVGEMCRAIESRINQI